MTTRRSFLLAGAGALLARNGAESEHRSGQKREARPAADGPDAEREVLPKAVHARGVAIDVPAPRQEISRSWQGPCPPPGRSVRYRRHLVLNPAAAGFVQWRKESV